MYESTIVVANDADALEALFSPEERDLGRSSYKITRKGNNTVFHVIAEDAVAFKTVMSTLSKIFIIWEKTNSAVTHAITHSSPSKAKSRKNNRRTSTP